MYIKSKPESFPTRSTLRDIAAWQLPLSQKTDFQVELPKLQRGFVWEPAKIMDLWDSILRGFPIGSMMISSIDPEPAEKGDSRQRYWLLDGQQRATSIALGFYDPWTSGHSDSEMWSLKSVPTLWLDLKPNIRGGEEKIFFPYLVTQSHPWGYNQDGGVIAWRKRREACERLNLGVNYFATDLNQCYPWEARLPIPITFLLAAANRCCASGPGGFWSELGQLASCLPNTWKTAYGKELGEEPPEGLDHLYQQLLRIPSICVHLNHLTKETKENDATNADNNSLLFVRLNASGTVLSGEELIFSLFKSAFPLAKEAVEECAAGFMAPSKLFGLFVRLSVAEEDPAKLARPVPLMDFKREIRTKESALRAALNDLLETRKGRDKCEAARLVDAARELLCGPKDGNALDFCLPEAVATRSINQAPEIFLALLYWLRSGGIVQSGSDSHRRLLGCFTALCWFQPGNSRARKDYLKEWVAATGEDVSVQLWSSNSLSAFFTRETLAVPFFPEPKKLKSLLLKSVLEVESYAYGNIPKTVEGRYWKDYEYLPTADEETEELKLERFGSNLMALLNSLCTNRNMLLYAQRQYVRERFQSFGQWELALKDTNCPWDWDHIYPTASGLHRVNPVYKDWHNTIGNLRIEGLSENRRDGCTNPADKLILANSQGKPAWQYSFIQPEIWADMQALEYRHNAIKDESLAKAITAIVLKRMVSIYEEWYRECRIGSLMAEIRMDCIHAASNEQTSGTSDV